MQKMFGITNIISQRLVDPSPEDMANAEENGRFCTNTPTDFLTEQGTDRKQPVEEGPDAIFILLCLYVIGRLWKDERINR